VFNEALYQIEMTRLLQDAADVMRRDYPTLVIYSVSIWTDPNAAASAVSVDTKENSNAKLSTLTAWAYARQAEALAAGDPELAVLLGTLPPRNRNPADFVLREVTSAEHHSFPAHWNDASRGDCWRELGPALQMVRANALTVFSILPLHTDAELAVNSASDWYDAPVPLLRLAI
jgi:hypothetical protein